MTKSKLTNRIETTILSNLVYNEEYTRKVIPFLKEDYFQDGVEKIIFQTIWAYAEKYKSNPTIDALVIDVQGKALNEEQYNVANINSDEVLDLLDIILIIGIILN